MPSAIGREDAVVGRGYGRGNSGLMLATGDNVFRFGDEAENLDSRLVISMDSNFTKAVVEALASIIPRVVSDTLKSSRYDTMLTHRSNHITDARERVQGDDHEGLSGDDREPRVAASVSVNFAKDVYLRHAHHGNASTGVGVLVFRDITLDAAVGKIVSGGNVLASDVVVSGDVSGGASGAEVYGAVNSGVVVSNARFSTVLRPSYGGLSSISNRNLDLQAGSSEVDESDHSQNEDAHSKGDVDPNVTSTINGAGCDQVIIAMPGTIVVSYNEVEKVDKLLAGKLDSFDVVRPTRGRLKKMAAKGGKETPVVSK
ncbi:hypothetical protein NE237_031117 [Protea cynaroides]|uniref:Uncharacterized protein n=1 Tax=Protea cynaroides TaxID=273540 RepID=A0A9Q0R299_9MAGN|nr:hypothetical protein NE237_031117 [Protea cynaroides]